jgi:hypothetical protein
MEAADNGVMPLELAAGIARAKGAKRQGVRLGRWLTAEQVEQLLTLPETWSTRAAKLITPRREAKLYIPDSS